MKVLITGGTGQVGIAIKKYLNDLNNDIVDVSRTGQIKEDLSVPGFAERVANIVKYSDAIIHCSAWMSKSVLDITTPNVNCSGTIEVIRLATILNVNKLIYISGVHVIGKPILLPIDEMHPVYPLSSYHASKLFGEHVVLIANDEKFKTIVLRIPSPIGPRTPRGKIFSEFVYHAVNNMPIELQGTGGRCQNYLDVRDIAVAVNSCLNKNIYGLYNIASLKSISNLDLANITIRTLLSNSKIFFSTKEDIDDKVNWNISSKKAISDFMFSPKISIEKSIVDYAETLNKI